VDEYTQNPTVNDLLKNGRGYSFFQVIRRLQNLNPEAPRLGHQGPARRERIRLRPHLDLVHPRTDIEDIRETEQPDGTYRYHVDVTFMGLYGSSSPLPMQYTEDMIRRDEHESLLRGFLDIFHHRLLSLFYRVWEKYRHSVQYDPSGRDYYSRRLLTLLGAALEAQPADQSLPAGKLLAYAGLLSQQPRSAESLRAAIQHHFPEGAVEIVQCKPRYAEIPASQRFALGARSCTLGSDTVLGSRVYDCSGNFEVRLGPLGLEDFLGMTPEGSSMDQLRELVDVMNSDGLDYEVTLILRGSEVPPVQLNNTQTRLGWSSWLGGTEGEDQTVTLTFKGWKHGRG
jgi:type VI secretion system protein ImpH